MKLFLVCMIRNEIDILPEFLSHIDGLFDSGAFVDHLSSDGSEQLMQDFAAARSGWDYHALRTPVYLQAEKSTEMLQRGFAAGADAVFFLDADEFIAGMDRAGLERAVDFMDTNKCIGQLQWRNCMPGEYTEAFSLDYPAWICDLAVHKKLVVPAWLYRRHGVSLGMNQGNHSLRLPAGAAIPATLLGELLHFPIRSRPQFVRKTIVSYVSQAMRPNKIVAPHIRMLFDAITQRDLTPEMLNALAVDYGSSAAIDRPLLQMELEARGFKRSVPNVRKSQLNMVRPLSARNSIIDFGDSMDYEDRKNMRYHA